MPGLILKAAIVPWRSSLLVKGSCVPLWVGLGECIADVSLVASEFLQLRHELIYSHGFCRGPPEAATVRGCYLRGVLGANTLDIYRQIFTSGLRRT